MVMPERLMPGNSASAWAAPMSSASATSQLPDLARVAPRRSASHRMSGADDQEDAG